MGGPNLSGDEGNVPDLHVPETGCLHVASLSPTKDGFVKTVEGSVRHLGEVLDRRKDYHWTQLFSFINWNTTD